MPTGFIKWGNYFKGDLTIEAWQNSFQMMYDIMKSHKIAEVQYKILHFIIPTREKLFAWGMEETELCRFCDEEIENVPHILIECEVSKHFLGQLSAWIDVKSGVSLLLTPKELIFGINNPNSKTINIIYMNARNFIIDQMNSQVFPTIRAFIVKMHSFLELEKQRYTRSNRIDDFNLLWGVYLE